MQRAWILLTLGLMACVSAETRAELTSDKDMYLDSSSIEEASGLYPIDDDDYLLPLAQELMKTKGVQI